MSDDFIDSIIRKKAMKTWVSLTSEKAKREEKPLTETEVIKYIKTIIEGSRSEEIIDKAVELYGTNVIKIFKEIVKLHMTGKIEKMTDYELYNLLTRLGFKIPLKTSIRIVRHGREEDFREKLSQ